MKFFEDKKIANCESYEKHRNKYQVLYLNMQEFLSKAKTVENMFTLMAKVFVRDARKELSEIEFLSETDLGWCMADVYQESKIPFVVLIDEWDCIFREYKENKEEQEKYLDFLRDLLKDKSYIALAYMTGILPIKKYGTHSALNMFDEYTMTNPRELAEFVVLYGRHRVGKTTLICEFMQDKKGIYYMSVEGTKKENLNGLSKVFLSNSDLVQVRTYL